MEQLLADAGSQLLKEGYAVLWLPSTDPTAIAIREARYASGALFGRLASSNSAARRDLATVRARCIGPDHTVGLHYFSESPAKRDSTAGRIDFGITNSFPKPVIESTESAVIFNDVRSHLLRTKIAVIALVARVLQSPSAEAR